MQKILREHIHLCSGPSKIPGQGDVTAASGDNLYPRNGVLKLGFQEIFWTLPFPTKYKHDSVDDYLQYEVTQPCAIWVEIKGLGQQPQYSSLSLWFSTDSSGDAAELDINFSIGKVTALNKTCAWVSVHEAHNCWSTET